MHFEDLTAAGAALVAPRPDLWPHALWCTISPNPNTKHSVDIVNSKGKRTKVQLPYGKMRQRDQYEYCKRVLKEYVYSEETKIFSTWELNKDGNVHFHLVMSDPTIKSTVDLKMFQRDILNCEIVLRNLHNRKMIDYMNNICFVTDSVEDRIRYMLKDKATCIHFPYLKTKNVILDTDTQIQQPLSVDRKEDTILPNEDLRVQVLLAGRAAASASRKTARKRNAVVIDKVNWSDFLDSESFIDD